MGEELYWISDQGRGKIQISSGLSVPNFESMAIFPGGPQTTAGRNLPLEAPARGRRRREKRSVFASLMQFLGSLDATH
jgi:hypothetical protein